MSITEIIENILPIMKLFVPGYIYICIFNYFANEKSDDLSTTIRSVVLSFIYDSISKLICDLLGTKNDIYIVLLSIFIAIIFALISVKLLFSRKYKRTLIQIGMVTGSNNIWEELFPRDCSTQVQGNITYHNEKAELNGTIKWYNPLEDGDCDIVLSKYCIITERNKKITDEGKKRLLYIKASEIKNLQIAQGTPKVKQNKRKTKRLGNQTITEQHERE